MHRIILKILMKQKFYFDTFTQLYHILFSDQYFLPNYEQKELNMTLSSFHFRFLNCFPRQLREMRVLQLSAKRTFSKTDAKT